MNLSDPVTAALIGATATVLAALVQLRLSWRNELKERERARLAEREQVESGVLRAEALRRGEEGVAASALVGPCKAESAAAPGSRSDCSEQSAVRVAVCARVPASATVKEVLLYTRFEDTQQPWSDSRVQPGQDSGRAKFVEKFFERPDSDAAKQVCQGFVNWNGEKARLARIVVMYML